MVRSVALSGLLVLLSACAGNRAASATHARVGPIELTEKGHGLFVGHTDNGDVVIAANHYNAMNGLAVLDTDLGVSAKNSQGLMVCSREVVTGTHVPHWLCRYQRDIDQNRAETELALGMPSGSVHPSQSGSGSSLGAAGISTRASKTAAR
jgi:hypothetical protein